MYLRWTPSVGGDSGVDLPQCRIVLCAGRQPGWRSTQQSWPCPCFPSLPALQIFSPAPHLNKLEPWHTPSMQKSMMLCFILLFTQSSAPALLSSRQFSATHGAGTALGYPTPRPADSSGEHRHHRLSCPPAYPSQQAWMEAETWLWPGSTISASRDHEERDCCFPWHWLPGKPMENK